MRTLGLVSCLFAAFLLLAIQAPTAEAARCRDIRCGPGKRCVRRPTPHCVLKDTCATLRCRAGYKCRDGRRGVRCVRAPRSCAVKRCRGGYHCVESALGGRCVRKRRGCANKRCRKGFVCVARGGGTCVPRAKR
jgi:hypothetical protein